MQLEIKHLQRAIFTVDYIPTPELFDIGGRLISSFIGELPQFELSFEPTTMSFIRMRSGNRNLHIGLTQFTYFEDRPETFDVFVNDAIGKTQKFLSSTNIATLARLGIRLIYRIPVEVERFVPLSTWYDIPGMQDSRISRFELIDYQINLQEKDNRIIITLGQQREEDRFYRTINLHHQYFSETKGDGLKEIVPRFIDVLLDTYKGFEKEGYK